MLDVLMLSRTDGVLLDDAVNLAMIIDNVKDVYNVAEMQ